MTGGPPKKLKLVRWDKLPARLPDERPPRLGGRDTALVPYRTVAKHVVNWLKPTSAVGCLVYAGANLHLECQINPGRKVTVHASNNYRGLQFYGERLFRFGEEQTWSVPFVKTGLMSWFLEPERHLNDGLADDLSALFDRANAEFDKQLAKPFKAADLPQFFDNLQKGSNKFLEGASSHLLIECAGLERINRFRLLQWGNACFGRREPHRQVLGKLKVWQELFGKIEE